jgi:prepilin-type N-terminal cleavage/methylation domain-containing protein
VKAEDSYMCRNKGKIKAFTIIELSVVMAVSAILIAAVFYSFHYFNRHYQVLLRELEERQLQYAFEERLRRDFRDADYIIDGGQALKIWTGKGELEYFFYRDYLIRWQAARKDTLPYGLIRFSLEELSTEQQDRLVSGLQLSLQKEGADEFMLELYKEYSPEILMEGIKEKQWPQ